MRKYFELPKNDVQSEANNAWFEYCRTQAIPFITLRCRTKLADVEWDYIAYPPEIDNAFKNLDGELRDKAILILRNMQIRGPNIRQAIYWCLLKILRLRKQSWPQMNYMT